MSLQQVVNQGLTAGAVALTAAERGPGAEIVRNEVNKNIERGDKTIDTMSRVETSKAEKNVASAQETLTKANQAKQDYQGDKRSKEYRGLKAQAVDAERNVKGAKDALKNVQLQLANIVERRQAFVEGIKNRMATGGLLGLNKNLVADSKKTTLKSIIGDVK